MFAGKEVRVRLVGEAQGSYLELKKRTDKESQGILKSIERIREILKTNPQFGDPLRKDLIPSIFRTQGIQNLYRVELSNYWRMLYTLQGNEIDIFVFVLTISDHKHYDDIFGYRKK